MIQEHQIGCLVVFAVDDRFVGLGLALPTGDFVLPPTEEQLAKDRMHKQACTQRHHNKFKAKYLKQGAERKRRLRAEIREQLKLNQGDMS